MDTSKNKIEKDKIKIRTLIYAGLIIVVGYIVLVGALIYIFGINNKITKLSAKLIPYPVVIIKTTNFVSVSELNDNLASIKKFYESQDFSKIGLRVDFSTEDGKKRLKIRERQLINKMVEDKIIEILARQKGVKITKEIIDQEIGRKMEEYGDAQSIENKLTNLYGWTMEDLKKKIVKADLYKEELEKIFQLQNNSNDELRDKINKANEELTSGKDFSEVVRNYSEGPSAQNGGEIGWISQDQLIPVLAGEIFNIDKGKRSGILESELGYHIVEMEDKKIENENELVRIRQIFVRKKTFSDWLGENMKDIKVRIPLKDYYWDKDALEAQFSSEEMREFEKNIMTEFQGDASLTY